MATSMNSSRTKCERAGNSGRDLSYLGTQTIQPTLIIFKTMCRMILTLGFILTAFSTSGSGFVITTPTPTTSSTAQRTIYGAFGPEETFFQVLPTVNRKAKLYEREVVTTSINTCGWTSRDANYPKTCPAGLGCGWVKGERLSDYAVVCVPHDDVGEWNWADAMVPTACYGYGGLNISIAMPWSQTYSSTLYCGTSAQHCATAVFDGGPPALSGVSTSFRAYTYTSMFCTDSVTRVRVYQQVTNSVEPSSTPNSSSPVTSSSSSSLGINQNANSAGSSTESTSTSPTATQKSSGSTPVGTIAGAAVGGIVGIGAIAALAGILIWRKRDTRRHAPVELSREVREFGSSPRYSVVRQ